MSKKTNKTNKDIPEDLSKTFDEIDEAVTVVDGVTVSPVTKGLQYLCVWINDSSPVPAIRQECKLPEAEAKKWLSNQVAEEHWSPAIVPENMTVEIPTLEEVKEVKAVSEEEWDEEDEEFEYDDEEDEEDW